MNRKYPITGRRQRGFTLVEILIALVIGLILTGGIIQVFSSTRQSNRVQEAISRMQENGRMALEVIARDARMADFWGCSGDIANVTNHLDSGESGFINFGVGGVDGTDSGGSGADTLVLRGGTGNGLILQAPFGPATSSALNVTTGNGLDEGDVVMISDCETADIFQVSNDDADTTGSIAHTTGGSITPGNDNVFDPGCPGASAHCLSKVYDNTARVFTTNQVTYSIATGSEGLPALFRNGQEFLDGIEDFQVLYGEDTDGNSVADYYVAAGDVVDMTQVISIRFAIVTVSSTDRLYEGPAQTYRVLGANRTSGDTRIRQVYTSTVTLRNRIG